MKNKLLIGLLVGVSGAYLLHRPLPGDDLVPHPMLETTHAVSIHAPRADIWPWLVQMGYDHAWWYTDERWYQWVDKYIWHTCHPTSPDHIIPALQHLEIGDTVLDGSPGQRSVCLYVPIVHGTRGGERPMMKSCSQCREMSSSRNQHSM